MKTSSVSISSVACLAFLALLQLRSGHAWRFLRLPALVSTIAHALIFVLVPLKLCSQTSAVAWSSFNMGTGVPVSSTTQVRSTAGQAFVGLVQAGQTRIESGFWVIRLPLSGTVALSEPAGLPFSYSLAQNYPNPFNPSTTLAFELPEATVVALQVYDLLGREVARLVDERMEAGTYRIVWDGRAAGQQFAPSGIYIARLATPAFTRTIKLVLMK